MSILSSLSGGLVAVQFLLFVIFAPISAFVLAGTCCAATSRGRQVRDYTEISFDKIANCGAAAEIIAACNKQAAMGILTDGVAAQYACRECGLVCDHEVVLDERGRLLPWTSYDNIIRWSVNFIENCPTYPTKLGDDPWYLFAGCTIDGSRPRLGHTNIGHNVYWSVKTLARYYAYTGDRDILRHARLLVDRSMLFHTPEDWAWPNVPRTQDSNSDGEYTDDYSESDKICGVAVAYMDFYKLTGEDRYLDAARRIADTIAMHVREGDKTHSPLPFRIKLETGEIATDASVARAYKNEEVPADYTAHMVSAVEMFDQLCELGACDAESLYQAKRDQVLDWILRYPIENNRWSGYYEDSLSSRYNLNQQSPLETARYILDNPDIDPEYKEHVQDLIRWVENHFGKAKHYGATSIKEQDKCFMEMGSHTARYASVVAKWFGVTGDPEDREEAHASFALATYSAYNQYSRNGIAVNYVGIGFLHPWFSDSYFDYISHFLEGMAELPEMAPEDQDHIIGSSSMITQAEYSPGQIEYRTFDPDGREILRITFHPQVIADGEPLAASQWSFGEYRGVPGVLRIERRGVRHILIKAR